MTKKPTLTDVAERAGVSVAMASRVLSNYGYFSGETRNKVLKAAQAINYKPNTLARSLRTRRTHTIGVLISDIVSFFWSTLVRGIEDMASKSDYSVILCNSDELTSKGHEYLSTLYEKNVDGLIVSPMLGTLNYIKKLYRTSVPIVLVDRKVKGLDIQTIYVDNIAGAYEAVSHLINLGHSRIGIITGIPGLQTSEDRYAGYIKALQDNKIPIWKKLIKEGDFTNEKAYQVTRELLQKNDPPSALFVCSEPMISGCMLALTELKIAVPQEIALVGFDDPIWASFSNPPLTTVRQPSYTMGMLACEHLLRIISDTRREKKRFEDIILKPNLVVRSSCGAGQK